MSKQLDAELLVLAPTNQLSVTASSAVALPPFNTERGSTETQPTLALYDNNDIHMRDAGDDATAELYGE